MVEDIDQGGVGGAGGVAAAIKPEESDILAIYKNCIVFVRKFLKLHARLSHLPKDWVRSEVEMFLNSIGSSLNPEALKLVGGSPHLLEHYSIRMNLDFKFEPDEVHQIKKLIDDNIVLEDQKVMELARHVEESECFQRITRPQYKANLSKIRGLQDRIAKCEFIGTSRDLTALGVPSVKAVSEKFDHYAGQLVEKPNSVLDILTAAAFAVVAAVVRSLQRGTEEDAGRGVEAEPPLAEIPPALGFVPLEQHNTVYA